MNHSVRGFWFVLLLLGFLLVCGAQACQGSQVKQEPPTGREGSSSNKEERGQANAKEPQEGNEPSSQREAPRETVPEKSNGPESSTATDSSASGGVWGGLNIIDVHAHIGSFRGFDLSTPTLMSNIQKFGVQMALISNIDGANLPGSTANLDETKANQATVDTVRAYSKQLRGIAWSRPNDGSPSKVEPFLSMKIAGATSPRIFVGMKFHPEMNQFEADSAKIDPYMKLCAKYKLVAVFHNGGPGSNSSPERIYKAAQRFPTVPVVLYHMGFGGQHQASIQVAKEAKQKKNALLYLGTAQADPNAVVQAVQEVGSDRVMFGTDATYYGADHYDRYKAMIDLMKSKLSAADFQKVVRENAKQIFGL